MSWMMYVCLLGIARPANIMTKSPIASTSTAAPAQLGVPVAHAQKTTVSPVGLVTAR